MYTHEIHEIFTNDRILVDDTIGTWSIPQVWNEIEVLSPEHPRHNLVQHVVIGFDVFKRILFSGSG